MNGDTGTQQASDGANWHFKQGETAAPGAAAPSQQPPTTPSPMPRTPGPEIPPPQPTEIIGVEPVASSQYGGEITWTASEYADHEKSSVWYIGLAVITLLLVAVVYFLTKDIFSIVAIIAFAITFGIIGSYKPKIVSYHLGPDGLQINQHLHVFSQFKSFGVQREGAFPSIVFIPMKRFMPPVVVYFPPEDGDDVLAVLSQYLPSGPVPQDFIDRALRHVRF